MDESNTEQRIEGMAIEGKSVMLRDAKGHWLPGQSASPDAMITSSERGKELVTKRESDRRLAEAERKAGAARGLLAGVEQLVDRPITSDADAHAVIAEKLTLGAGTAAERGQMREAVAGFGYALRMADQAPADEKQRVPMVAIQINHIGADVAALADEPEPAAWRAVDEE